MDFVRYADRSADLVNAAQGGGLDDGPDGRSEGRSEGRHPLVRFLDGRPWLQESVTERDAPALRRFVRELRPVFEASNDRDEDAVVQQLNVLLAKHPVTPYISGHGRDGSSRHWHLHVADRDSSVSEVLIAESLLGLSTLVCEHGATRLGVCDASGCTDVFVDTSPNQSRRYCSDRCSSRANVAAYRARQKAASAS